jgi:NAD(P)-dependent dehydrogenase (short-subunit alcohol dehydrogenase family)
MTDFTGRVVLVTGATGGLGATVVGAFVERKAVVVGISGSGKTLPGLDDQYTAVRADLPKEEGARTAADRALAHNGKLDVVVHVLGGFAGGQPVSRTTDETWDRMMTLNLKAAFLVARATLPALLRSPVGRLIAVGSRAGITPSPGIGAYAVSKAALHALVQTIAEEVKGTGTTANAVVPGIIDTPANRVDMSSADFSKWVKPEAIAELIIYLASDEGAAVNGALIPAYGSG